MQRRAGDQVTRRAEDVVYVGVLDGQRCRHALAPVDVVGDPDSPANRETVIRVWMVETVLKVAKNFEGGPMTPGFSNMIRGIVVQIGIDPRFGEPLIEPPSMRSFSA